MPKKKGKCINFGGGCSKAKNREIQEADVTNFVCEECGKPLKETKEKTKPRWKMIAAIVAAVLILGGGGAYFAMNGGSSSDWGGDGTPVDTTDTINGGVIDTIPPGGKDDSGDPDTSISVPPTPPASPVLSWGKWDGPISGGKAHGMGTVAVTKSHDIDLKDSNGSVVKVVPGDKIMSAKFKNGKLVQGELHRKDGTRAMIVIGG